MLSVLTTIRNKIKMEQDKELNLYGCNRYPHIIEERVVGNWSGGTESWESPGEDDRMTGRGGRL